jgi:hypothetical protein
VPPEAVLVHGCKDGTLAELLLGAAEYYVPKERVTPKEDPVEEIEKLLHTNIVVTDSLPPGVGAVVINPAFIPPPPEVPSGSPNYEREVKGEVAPPLMDTVKQVQLTQYPPTDNPVAEVKPKITRTAFEAMRKSKKGVAIEMAQGLGISLGDFALMLREFGYIIAKGGKLKSTEP